MIEVKVDSEAFADWIRRAAEDLRSGARQALGQSVALALRHARLSRAFEDRTGALRRSITRGQTGPWVHFIRTGDSRVKYAKFVEDGTKAHTIVPKRTNKSGLLRWRSGGRWFSKREVHHKGSLPAYFMRDAAREGAEALLVSLERVANRAFL